MRVVVAGGTGFLGSSLVDRLRRDGHDVATLTRQPTERHHLRWDPYGPVTAWAHALEEADAVVNLAGATISKRWSAAYKRTLWNSRVHVTRSVVAAMRSVQRMPPTLVSASGIGIYGPRADEPLTEETGAGAGFLADLGAAWEKEALAAGPEARVVVLRTGVVLARNGGALPQMALPFRLFAGGPIGSGRQYVSWIHADDWTTMAAWALANAAVAGPLNVTAPNPVTNGEFARTLGRVLHRPAFFPAPAFAVRLALGEMADVALTGQRVLPGKASSLGFAFRHPLLEPALRAIYG
jgi:uncharacterized protein (TIGR01777 family)